MLLGYCRVSTAKQDLTAQKMKLRDAGVKEENIYTDVISGAKFDRKGLKEMMKMSREGDTIIVLKLDRLGRSLSDLISLFKTFDEKGLKFLSICENIDTSTPSGKFMFQITGAFAEFERNIIRQRTMIGLEAARAMGRIGGRPTVMTAAKTEMAKALHSNKNLRVSEILETLGVSRGTYYKMLNIIYE